MFSIYLIEIRNRILLLLFGIFFYFFIFYSYKDVLLYTILTTTGKDSERFVCLCVSELLNSYFFIIFYLVWNCVGYQIFYQVLSFLKTALYCEERFFFNKLFYMSLFVHFFATTVFHEVFFNLLLRFFAGFFNSDSLIIKDSQVIRIFFELRLEEFVTFYLQNHFLFVSFSQLVLFSLLLLTVYVKFIKFLKKLFYLLFVLISTLMTPPDLFYQSFLFFAFILFFEFYLFFFFICDRINLEERLKMSISRH